MKLKLVLLSVLLSAAGFAATTLTWIKSPVEESVLRYYLEHRPSASSEWIRVEVDSSQNRVTIPESAYGRWFRIAAVNSFGVGEYTDPVKLPDKIKGLSLVVEITP